MRLRKLWARLGGLYESWRGCRRDATLLVAGADVLADGYTVEVFRWRRGRDPSATGAGAGPSPTFRD